MRSTCTTVQTQDERKHRQCSWFLEHARSCATDAPPCTLCSSEALPVRSASSHIPGYAWPCT
ncbi:hypothetical protein Hdeb2414_s0004g00124721 [Helianthus debilis subsp. tardiflorus]